MTCTSRRADGGATGKRSSTPSRPSSRKEAAPTKPQPSRHRHRNMKVTASQTGSDAAVPYSPGTLNTQKQLPRNDECRMLNDEGMSNERMSNGFPVPAMPSCHSAFNIRPSSFPRHLARKAPQTMHFHALWVRRRPMNNCPWFFPDSPVVFSSFPFRWTNPRTVVESVYSSPRRMQQKCVVAQGQGSRSISPDSKEKPMNRSTTLMIALALLLAMGQAQASIIADARDDFVAGTSEGEEATSIPATGTGTWSYLASDTANPTSDGDGLDALTWKVADSAYMSWAGGSSVHLQHDNLASDEIFMHPIDSHPKYVVVRWIVGAAEAGSIDISGNVRKVDPGSDMKGSVTFELFVDGSSLTSSTLAYNDTTGVAFDETVTVSVGSTVDFVIGPNGGIEHDGTGLQATITPEPTTLGMLALGAVALLRRRRR